MTLELLQKLHRYFPEETVSINTDNYIFPDGSVDYGIWLHIGAFCKRYTTVEDLMRAIDIFIATNTNITADTLINNEGFHDAY